jgi:4'-phosphopantetheinyl transferase
LLRGVLAKYLEEAPNTVPISTTDFGKPILSNDQDNNQRSFSHRIYFNLSHSGDFVVLAISHHSDIGIDIEQIRLLPDYEEIMSKDFTPSSLPRLRRIPKESQALAFWKAWVRKESVVKAEGSGISEAFISQDVPINPECVFAYPVRDPESGAQRFIYDLAMPSNYVSALTTQAGDAEISYVEPKYARDLLISLSASAEGYSKQI